MFKKSVRKVSTLNSAVSHWQGAAAKDDTNPSGPDFLSTGDPQTRRKSLFESFKTAVDKVKIKAKIVTTFDDSDEDDEFHTIFRTSKTNNRRVTILHHIDEEEDENILKDIPPMTEEQVTEFTSNELVGRLLKSKYFRSAILTCIITNSLLIAVETDKNLERKYNRVFGVLDQLMMTIFVCEILLKWYHGFVRFWKQGWNILDFLIVALLLFGPLVMKNSSGAGRGVLRILRVLRAFRSLRSISSLPGLQVVVQTILQSVPDMTNIVLLLVIIMLVFSVIGITMFRDTIPRYFGDLSTAMFSLFVCVTQDGWMEIFEGFQEQGTDTYYGGGLFLVLFISIGAFIFANLVVAVVVTNLECAVKDVRKEEEQQAKELELKGKLEKELGDNEAEIIKDDDTPSSTFQTQLPYLVPDLTGMDVRNIEHYFLVLSAMEENLSTYRALKQELVQFFDEICELNKSAMAEGVIEETEEDLTAKKRANEAMVSSYRRASMAGDILSEMMTLEGSSLINTKNKTRMTDVINVSANVSARVNNLDSGGSNMALNNRGRRRSSLAGHRRQSLPVNILPS